MKNIDAQISPFNFEISFKKAIGFWEDKENEESNERQRYAADLLLRVSEKPFLKDGFSDLTLVDKNGELIAKILEHLFPKALSGNELKAVLLPNYNHVFQITDGLKKVLENSTQCHRPEDILVFQNHQYVLSCFLILRAHYNIELDLNFPLIVDIPDKDGTIKHYRVLFNFDFVEILKNKKSKEITEEDLTKLLDNFQDLDLWKEKFPPSSWTMKGFVICTLVDVTTEIAISELKSFLVKPSVENKKENHRPEQLFQSIFNIGKLKAALFIADRDSQQFSLLNTYEHNSDFFSCLKEVNISEFKNYFEYVKHSKRPYIISNTEKSVDNLILKAFFQDNEIKSCVFAPITNNEGETLGVLFFCSSTKYAISTILEEKIALITPLLVDSLERAFLEIEIQIDAVIQKEYTSIHPSVYWKFREEVKNKLNLFKQQKSTDNTFFKEIVFNEVFPLYGQIDIKNSSNKRNEAIKEDLFEQISQIIVILKIFTTKDNSIILKQIEFELENYLLELEKPLKNNLEQLILGYLNTEIHPILINQQHVAEVKGLIEDYFSSIDPKTGLLYKARKSYDDTVTKVNQNFAVLLDERQIHAQEIFPHYYERYKTDGVEHNLYIGASISPVHKYHRMYLNNLRLWQFETLCEMNIHHQLMQPLLTYPLEVTSLIFVFGTAISIRFRMDEKHFDVDGSYNARYEVIKKRIDKALVKNSDERITQQGKITIVYSHFSEEQEYVKYINYLQHKDLLEGSIEYLDIEDLQGITGLKALRVKVNEDFGSILKETEIFVTELFNKNQEYKFHNLEHTKRVVENVKFLADNEHVTFHDKFKLIVAAWFHDTGHIHSAENHESHSIDIATAFMEKTLIPKEIIKEINDLIWATNPSQDSNNKLQSIIKDADLSHLASEDYFSCLTDLKEEWGLDNLNGEDWINNNIAFLKDHQFYTDYAKNNWQQLKLKNIQKLSQKLKNK